MELLHDWERTGYPQRDRPGRLRHPLAARAAAEEMVELLHARRPTVLDAGQLWVNPDCGLKTRGWPETEPALRNMVAAARQAARAARPSDLASSIPPCSIPPRGRDGARCTVLWAMAARMVQRSTGALWTLSKKQHGVVERGQLLDIGFSAHAISHRIETGRLHPVHSGVYAVGRPTLTQHGQWMAAVLSCGPSAALSHASAAALWGLLAPTDRIDVSVPAGRWRGRAGVIVHRRPTFTADDVVIERGIRVMTAIGTLIDIAAIVSFGTLEAAINEADKRSLANPSGCGPRLMRSSHAGPGIGIMRKVLDRTDVRPDRLSSSSGGFFRLPRVRVSGP